jgi:carboxymethylenebutenolidase
MKIAAIFLCMLACGTGYADVDLPIDERPVTFKSGNEMVTAMMYGPRVIDKAQVLVPAIVVIHEWWGQNDFVKKKARDFAAKGYIVLAVDLYRGQVATDPDTAHQLSHGLPHDRALRDLRAAVDKLASITRVPKGHIGFVGWCMGGGYAIELAAADPRIHATVAYYGGVLTDARASPPTSCVRSTARSPRRA